MGRTAAVYSFPAALIALAWLRLEDPRAAGGDGLWVVLLALAPALASTLALRLGLSVPAVLTAAWVALHTPATDDRPGFFGPVLDRFGDGFLDYYDVEVPFSGVERPHMHGVLVLAVFGFCLLLAHAVAARRPLPAVFAVIAGAGWPATLDASQSAVYGALILAAALWVLAGLRASRPLPALAAGALIVLVAAGASTSAALAKDGVLAWERWNPTGPTRTRVSVSYVWESNYTGIEFPERATVVLRIRGPQRGLYWRATTLDQFDADRWLESPTPLSAGPAQGRLPNDPLLPARSLNPRTWIRQEVEVVGLRDARVVAASQPVALDARQLGGVFRLSGGLVRVYGGLRRGQRYTAHSYAPRPEPAALAKLGADYPPALDRFLDIGRTRVDSFGFRDRERFIDERFSDERYLALWPYERLWEEAKRLRAGARTPYGAVIAIETWLRSTGGFTYDEAPPPTGGVPALAHFVSAGKAGYCQQFAGAMALMLRFLGIPARVAAGFTSGKRENGGWTVTDRDAHAWVEVWFPAYGWLSFDPTPGRGNLAGSYSASSAAFNAGDAVEAFGPSRAGANAGGAGELGRLLELKERLAEREAAASRDGNGSARTIWLLLVALVAAGAAIAAAKLVHTKARYLTRDPRRLAAAMRRELVDYLADQGHAVGPSTTPEELRRLVRERTGADAQPFTAALAEARFGPPAASAAAAARARRELKGVLRTVRDGLSRTARLRGLVGLRSLRA